jgi:hypothetical protein
VFVRTLDPWFGSPSSLIEPVLPFVREAILERQTLLAHYAGHPITIWPYALGWRQGALCLLGLWLRNEPRAQPVAMAWLPLERLSGLVSWRGYWIEAGPGLQAWLDTAAALDTVRPPLLPAVHPATQDVACAPTSPGAHGSSRAPVSVQEARGTEGGRRASPGDREVAVGR